MRSEYIERKIQELIANEEKIKQSYTIQQPTIKSINIQEKADKVNKETLENKIKQAVSYMPNTVKTVNVYITIQTNEVNVEEIKANEIGAKKINVKKIVNEKGAIINEINN